MLNTSKFCIDQIVLCHTESFYTMNQNYHWRNRHLRLTMRELCSNFPTESATVNPLGYSETSLNIYSPCGCKVVATDTWLCGINRFYYSITMGVMHWLNFNVTLNWNKEAFGLNKFQQTRQLNQKQAKYSLTLLLLLKFHNASTSFD